MYEDWQNAFMVPLYKGKGNKCEFLNYRGISLLRVPIKLYGRVMTERLIGTKHQTGEEQCGFMSSRCVDQLLAFKTQKTI